MARAPEIRRDVEEAIREGSVDGLLTAAAAFGLFQWATGGAVLAWR